jgi:hypothetical protein
LWLGYQSLDARALAIEDLFSLEVTAIGKDG